MSNDESSSAKKPLKLPQALSLNKYRQKLNSKKPASQTPTARKCHGCKQEIIDHSAGVRVGEIFFHMKHFCCHECSCLLHGQKFFSKKDKFYCEKDFNRLFGQTCRGCNEKIISGRIARACGGVYHRDHFRCTTCDVRLVGKYFIKDDEPYCAQHGTANLNLPSLCDDESSSVLDNFKEISTSAHPQQTPANTSPNTKHEEDTDSNTPVLNHPPKATATSGQQTGAVVLESCDYCKEKIRKDIVRASGKTYHARCLKCEHCQRPINKSGSMIYRREGHLYCKQDFEERFCDLCTLCGEPILEGSITVNAEFYHSSCFQCFQCKKMLDKYLSIGGELRCSDHVSASKLIVVCNVCEEEIPLHLVVACIGFKFHPDCFRCSFCQQRLDKLTAKLRDKLACCPECLASSSIALHLPTQPKSKLKVLATRLKQAELTYRNQPPSAISSNMISRSRKPALDTKLPRRKNRANAASDPKVSAMIDANALTDAQKTSSSSSLDLSVATSQQRHNQKTMVEKFSSNESKLKTQTTRLSSRSKHKKLNTSPYHSGDINKAVKWKKGELIGKGSFGKVYMGMTVSGELIAVKQVMLKNVQDKEKARQLESEIRVMEKLRHPNIVALLGTEREENKFSILMEFVPGKSIDVLLESFGKFQEETICMYTRQLVSALHYMHTNDIIHRDIKGKNILVDTNGNLKLADFGSAKQFDNILSKEAPSISYNYTPLWTAPEVLLGNYDRKVDIWSLGCVLIEMATAKTPWSECKFDNPFRALYHIGNSSSIPSIPEGLSPIGQSFIQQCLIRSADDRPDAADLLKHEFLLGQDSSDDSEDEHESHPQTSVYDAKRHEKHLSDDENTNDTVKS